MKKLSIIVPCFNSEKTIDTTFSSFLGLSNFTNYFEIIFINDGSTDQTKSKINDFINNNISFNTVLFNQENKGLSQARNKGLEIAKFDYVWFVDSDDQIIVKDFENLLKVLKDRYELISFSVLTLRGKIETTKRNNLNIDDPKIGAQYYIYDRFFLLKNNLFFVPNLIHEDLEYLPRVFSLNPRYYYLDKCFYRRIITEGSITTSTVKLQRVISLLEIAFKHYINYDKYQSNFGYYSIIALNNAFRLTFKLSSEDFASLKKFIIKNIKNINLILKVRQYNLSKLKSFFSIFFFNLLALIK